MSRFAASCASAHVVWSCGGPARWAWATQGCRITQPSCHGLMVGLRRGRRGGQRSSAANGPEGVAR
eukprot:2063319-Amphidinium_carterae.1